jgi:tryptophan synthase alpha chain
MSRIAATLAALKASGRTALIPYVTAGFPQVDVTPDLMHGMVAAGADILELGVPFSDPSADGAVIQKAGDKALAAGVGLVQVLEMVRTFRQDNTHPPRRPAWRACWSLTTRRRNAPGLPPTCAAMAWT